MKRLCVCVVLFLLACENEVVGPKPAVTAIRPARGYNGVNTTVTISGSGFALLPLDLLAGGSQAAFPEVIIETTPATVLGASSTGYSFKGPTEIQAAVPPGLAPGTYAVSVVNPDGQKTTLQSAFVVTNTPDIVISKITPPFGWKDAKTNISIVGIGFQSTPKVKLVKAGVETLLTRVAFIDSNSITALVSPGMGVGLYDVVATNPDGGVGIFAGSFTITQDPPPIVVTVSPAVAGSGATPLLITVKGFNFRAGAVVRLVNDASSELNHFGTPSLDGSTEIRVSLTSTPAQGAYLLRVRNTDNTYGDYSAFVIKPTSLKLEAMAVSRVPGTVDPRRLSFARMGLGAVSAKDELGNTFLYAVGGEGTGGQLLTAVEVAQVDPFGRLSAWRTVPYAAPARSRASVVAEGDFVYLVGGEGPSGATDSVLRAEVQRNDGAPAVTAATPAAGGSLAAGTWYYKVSARIGAAGAGTERNPGGETLPSDEVTADADATNKSVALTWSAVTGAVSYMVYRSDAPNGVSGTEHRIAADVVATTFTDTGAAAGTASPMPPGALGVFKEVGRLGRTRAGVSAAIGHTATSGAFLYALGGDGADASTTWERADVVNTGAGGALTFAPGGTALPLAIADAVALQVGPANAPALPAAAKNYLYLVGGTSGAGKGVSWAEIQDDGSLLFREVSRSSTGMQTRSGLGVICANNVFYMMGGMEGGSPQSSGRQTEIASGALLANNEPNLGAFSSSSAGLTIARGMLGMTIANAFVYAVAGRDGSGPLDTTDQGIW